MLHALEQFKWHTGSDKDINFREIINKVKECVSDGGRLFIGSDSFISKNKVNFATAICLYGDGKGGRYFFHKEYLPKKKYNFLVNQAQILNKIPGYVCRFRDNSYYAWNLNKVAEPIWYEKMLPDTTYFGSGEFISKMIGDLKLKDAVKLI